jgi:hypothetical protein
LVVKWGVTVIRWRAVLTSYTGSKLDSVLGREDGRFKSK